MTKKALWDYYGIILIFIWIIVQSLLFFRYGFTTEFEGVKYQDDASNLLIPLNYITERLFYILYSIIIAFFIKIKFGLYGVLIFQLLVNAWSTYRFHALSTVLFKNKVISFIVTVTLILTIQIQIWNFHLYTESLFISGIILLTYRIVNFKFNKLTDYFLVSFLILLLSFLRPNGVLLLIPSSLFFLYNFRIIRKYSLFIIPFIVSLLFIIGINFSLNSGNFIEYINQAWKSSWVVWGYDNPNIYMFHNPNIMGDQGVELVLDRIVVYFSMLRPYYSTFHNFLMMTFYPIYLLSLIGVLFSWRKNKSIFVFVTSLVFVFSSFSILSFINWHGRFIAPVLPLFIIMSGFALCKIFTLIKKN